MDDTTHRQSDAATRKRRSSILKAVRPARAPLSELEFHVATPTDTTKGRRVSFSRNSRVAEFTVTESLITWKDRYEEQNRTLELSGNEAEHAPASVHQLGNRLIDQQFQEIVSIDLEDARGANMESSLSQVALGNLDCTANDKNPPLPQQRFELSAFTGHQSNMFADDLAISGMGELTDKMSFNFSTMQPLARHDDLDELEKDLGLKSGSRMSRIVCQGPNFENELSETIEVDLNMTRVTTNDKSDMSITDTIRYPEVQDVSKSTGSISIEKPKGKDWIADKENILVNPYVAPKESDNFAVNDDPGKVLVFDGKRLTTQSDNILTKNTSARHSMIPEKKMPERKTIVLNVNDDLPNFVNDITASRLPNFVDTVPQDLQSKSNADDLDASTTQFLDQMLEMTEPTPSNPSNISMMQEPAKIILTHKSEVKKTIVYKADTGNLSVTDHVSDATSGSELPDRRKTIIYEDDAGTVSVTQAVVTHVYPASETIKKKEKRQTIVFEMETADISMTEAVPSNLVIPENKIVYDTLSGSISITKAELNDHVSGGSTTTNRRQTIVYENDAGNISMTEAIPTQFVEQAVPYKKRETILFDNDMGDVSATAAVDCNLILAQLTREPNSAATDMNIDEYRTSVAENVPEKRKTIVFEADAGDVSMTQAIPSNIIHNVASTTMLAPTEPSSTLLSRAESDSYMMKWREDVVLEKSFKNSENYADNMSMTQVASTNLLLDKPERRKTIVYESENGDLEMTQALPVKMFTNQMEPTDSEEKIVSKTEITSEARFKDIHETGSDNADVSMTALECDDSKMLLASDSSAVTLGNEHLVDPSKLTTSDSASSKEFEFASLKKDILENSMIDVLLTMTPQTRRNMNTIVYQTNAGKNPTLKPKAIEFSAPKTEPSEKSSASTVPSLNELEEKPVARQMKKAASPVEKSTSQSPSAASMSKIEQDLKNALLYDLLDMSNVSVDIGGDGYDDKCVTAKIESETSSVTAPEPTKRTASGESFFLIKDDEEEDKTRTEKYKKDKKMNLDALKPELKVPLQIEFKQRVPDAGIKFEIAQPEPKVAKPEPKEPSPELKSEPKSETTTIKVTSPCGNRHFEDIHSREPGVPKRHRDVRNADNTRELLEILADFTDREEEKNPIQPLATDKLSVENKDEIAERMQQAVPRRQSVSREFLGSTSTVLQKPQMADYTNNTTLERSVSQKTVQAQCDVVKTLRFEDDESVSGSSVKFDVISPLKKTAFGETSYMKEGKTNVIPSYLKDVSDGLKQLMSDLVKPNADTLPFDTGRPEWFGPYRAPSTCSMQVEANLIGSSQIEVTEDKPVVEESSSHQTTCISSFNDSSVVTEIPPRTDDGTVPESERASRSIIKTAAQDLARSIVFSDSLPHKRDVIPKHLKSPEPVIIFDRDNPLNNVLIAPIDFSLAHKYDPRSHDSLPRQSSQVRFREEDGPNDSRERVTAQFNVETCLQKFGYMPGGDADMDKMCQDDTKYLPDKYSGASLSSKVVSADVGLHVNFVDAPPSQLINSEANTVIAMKENKQLLIENSSLTIVDDIDSGAESPSSQVRMNLEPKQKQSPVEILYCPDAAETNKTQTCPDTERPDEAKPKKRSRPPNTEQKGNKNAPRAEITPKPTSKLRKISNSPTERKSDNRSPKKRSPATSRNRTETRTATPCESLSPSKTSGPSALSPKKKLSPKSKKPNTQTITELHVAKPSRAGKRDAKPDSEGWSVQDVGGDASSVYIVNTGNHENHGGFVKNDSSPMDWQPELLNEPSSKDLVAERDSDVDVLEKIDKLPFMGGRDCEWESATVNAWVFRVLRSRLRLVVRLARGGHGGGAVRADTPLGEITVEPVQKEKDVIAVLCLRFAAEAVRHEAARACCARDVPALLRRSAGVARVAARWARVMFFTKTRLAYSLTDGGRLEVKVANVPLRSVWEVSMHLEMAQSDRESPWPRACRVRVARVLGRDAPADAVQRALASAPSDWGHAPHVIWKIFKHLKHLAVEDEMIQ